MRAWVNSNCTQRSCPVRMALRWRYSDQLVNRESVPSPMTHSSPKINRRSLLFIRGSGCPTPNSDHLLRERSCPFQTAADRRYCSKGNVKCLQENIDADTTPTMRSTAFFSYNWHHPVMETEALSELPHLAHELYESNAWGLSAQTHYHWEVRRFRVQHVQLTFSRPFGAFFTTYTPLQKWIYRQNDQQCSTLAS